MKLELKQKVWKIEINKPSEHSEYKSRVREEGVKIDVFEIIGISDFKICINNDWFTTLDKEIEGRRKDRKYNTYLEDIKTNIRTDNSILGDGVFVTLYSTKKPTKRTLRKMVASASIEIDKRYGFLFAGAKKELYNMADNYKF